MATLRNAKHELFCRGWLKHQNATKAYREAGYKARGHSAEQCAHRLLRHAEVKHRINEVRRHMSYRTKVTVESLLQDAAQDRELARRLDQPGAALQATQFMAKLVGLMVDRKETGSPGDFASLETTAAIVEKVRAELGDNAATALQALLGASQGSQAALDETPAEPGSSLN